MWPFIEHQLLKGLTSNKVDETGQSMSQFRGHCKNLTRFAETTLTEKPWKKGRLNCNFSQDWSGVTRAILIILIKPDPHCSWNYYSERFGKKLYETSRTWYIADFAKWTYSFVMTDSRNVSFNSAGSFIHSSNWSNIASNKGRFVRSFCQQSSIKSCTALGQYWKQTVKKLSLS